jgi:ABC-type transport system involved in multi-copper enzyme maturation permease subunit
MGLMVLFGLMATAVVVFTVRSGSGGSLPGTGNVTRAMLEAKDGMFAGLRTFEGMLGIVALVVWAMSVTHDYSSGLIRLLVQAEPSRWRLLLGKVVALSLFTCAATLLTTVVVVAAAPALAGPAGISTHAWGSDIARTLIDGYVQLTVSVLLWGVFGLFVGVMTRNTGIAIAIGIGYLLLFEGVISMLLKNAVNWLPGKVFATIASGGTPGMSFGTAVLVAVIYALAALVAAVLVFQHRDITA